MMKKSIENLFSIFEEHRRELYMVGGAVRDLLLGAIPDDYDFTSNATPDEMEVWFERTVTIGSKYGTVGVIVDGEHFEITTYRVESEYQDGRHPDKVHFGTDVVEDVRRRDFTINGLLMDKNGAIIDYVGGLRDIEAGEIRTIGKPEERFAEDKLRKWRAIRLAAEKAMLVEQQTTEAIRHNPDIDGISIERIQIELNRLVISQNPTWGGYLLVKTGLYQRLMERVLPAYAERGTESFMDTFEIIGFMKPALESRLAALMINMHEEEWDSFLTKMRYSKKMQRTVIKLLKNLRANADNMGEFKERLSDFTQREAELLFDLQRGVGLWAKEPTLTKRSEKNSKSWQEILERQEPLHLKDIAVGATDLMAVGITGSDISIMLKELLTHLYTHPEDNTREKLMRRVERKMNGQFDIASDH